MDGEEDECFWILFDGDLKIYNHGRKVPSQQDMCNNLRLPLNIIPKIKLKISVSVKK